MAVSTVVSILAFGITCAANLPEPIAVYYPVTYTETSGNSAETPTFSYSTNGQIKYGKSQLGSQKLEQSKTNYGYKVVPSYIKPPLQNQLYSTKHEVEGTHKYSKPIAIVRMASEMTDDGRFNYKYKTENGIEVEASGFLKATAPRGIKTQVMTGKYSYTSPEGTPISARWYADDTGFHIDGVHLPKSPSVPVAVSRSTVPLTL